VIEWANRVRRPTCVEHDGLVVAEQQIDEVALVAEALADAQNEGIGVVLVHLDQGIGGMRAVGSPMDPSLVRER
jgi:hypothetical protein